MLESSKYKYFNEYFLESIEYVENFSIDLYIINKLDYLVDKNIYTIANPSTIRLQPVTYAASSVKR